MIDIRNFYFDGLNPNSMLELHQLLVTMSPNKQVRPDVVSGFALAETCFRQGVRPFTLSEDVPCGTNMSRAINDLENEPNLPVRSFDVD
ncbi:hypothetical protein ACLUXI_00570 [Bifidobacterium apri]